MQDRERHIAGVIFRNLHENPKLLRILPVLKGAVALQANDQDLERRHRSGAEGGIASPSGGSSSSSMTISVPVIIHDRETLNSIRETRKRVGRRAEAAFAGVPALILAALRKRGPGGGISRCGVGFGSLGFLMVMLVNSVEPG